MLFRKQILKKQVIFFCFLIVLLRKTKEQMMHGFMRAIVLATPHIEATHTLVQRMVQVLLLFIQLYCLENRNATCGYTDGFIRIIIRL